MEARLRRDQAVGDDEFGRIGRVGEQGGQRLALDAAERLEHEIGGILTTGRAPDADAHAREVGGADRRGDVADAVMTAVPAAGLQPNGVERDVQLIVQHDQL